MIYKYLYNKKCNIILRPSPISNMSQQQEYHSYASTYQGRYGVRAINEGPIVYAQYAADKQPYLNNNKELIFVVDLSASMSPSIHQLRSSLKAVRDTILSLTGTTQHNEKAFRQAANIRLIGFSKDAWEFYSSEDSSEDITWDKIIDKKIIARDATNMGAGLLLAFDRTSVNKATWIVVMTDGHCNRGLYRTCDSFKRLLAKCPQNTQIVTLGYGKNFQPDILQVLGDFTYIEDEEAIPIVLGSLANEFMTSWGFKAKFIIPEYDNQQITANIGWGRGSKIPTSNGFSKGETVWGRVIIGQKDIGALYDQREVAYGYLMSDSVYFEQLPGQQIFVEYISLLDMTVNRIELIIAKGDQPPQKVREYYYLSAKGRRLMAIYHALYKGRVTHVIPIIKADIDKWQEDCALSHKEDILAVLEECQNGCANNSTMYRVASQAGDGTRQNSHSDVTMYTLSQRESVNYTRQSFDVYIVER